MSKIRDYTRAKLESVIDLRVSGALSNKDDTIADNIIANNISIGTSGSDYILDVVSETDYMARAGVTQYSNVSSDGPNLNLRRAKGTEGVPTVVVDENTLGTVHFYGHDGTNFEIAASIWGVVDGDPGNNDMPGKLLFKTTPDGSTTEQTRMIINNAGRVSIGSTEPSYKLDVRENRASGWTMGVTNDGDNANRYGMFIECGADNAAGTNYALGIFAGAGDGQGYVTFSGGTVTYGPFTGEHYTELEDAAEYEFGTLLKIVSASQGPQGKSVNYTCTQTTSAKDPAVLGIYGANLQDAPGESLNEKHTVWALGDGFVLVCDEGGDISTGDYICSSNTAGHGKKQDDDLLHNYTVAKASQPVAWSEESGSQKLIACTYHCG